MPTLHRPPLLGLLLNAAVVLAAAAATGDETPEGALPATREPGAGSQRRAESSSCESPTPAPASRRRCASACSSPSSRVSPRGLGLGLSISDGIVEAHRAEVMEKLEARSLSELMRLLLLAEPRGSKPGENP